MIEWPWVSRAEYDRVRLENYTFRDALREANAELFKLRLLVGNLRTGHEQTTRVIENIFKRKP